MREIASDVRRWRARGDRVALATVVATRRSAPRPVGAKLALSERGDLAGSVSAGCVENDVCALAEEVLAGAPARLLTYGIADDLALDVGLPCGGEIDVFVEPWRSPSLDRLLGAAEQGEPAARAAVVEGGPQGLDAVVLANGERLGEGAAELGALAAEHVNGRSTLLELGPRRVFVDVVGPPPRLIVFGAVDVAEALCRLAGVLGWHTTVVDPRARLATRERVPSADELVVAWPDAALERLAPDAATAVVVLTHDDKLDLPALAAGLRSGAFYVGALGSRKNQARRRERLSEQDVDAASLERLAGPIGLDIGADTPAETALSILAEILARRSGRSGTPLKEGSGRIHRDIG